MLTWIHDSNSDSFVDLRMVYKRRLGGGFGGIKTPIYQPYPPPKKKYNTNIITDVSAWNRIRKIN